MRGVQNLDGVALRVTGTVPLPLGDPSTQRSMNRVVAQQELERQNFRVRGSGGDAVFRPAARWLRPPFPVTVRLTQGITPERLKARKRSIQLWLRTPSWQYALLYQVCRWALGPAPGFHRVAGCGTSTSDRG